MRIALLLVALGYVILVGGCATWVPPSTPTVGEAIVVGDVVRRTAFEDRIAAVFPGFENTNAYLNCVQGYRPKCERAPAANDNRLVYRFIREYPKVFQKFGTVWHKVQKDLGDGTPAILLTFTSASIPDCPKTGCPNNPLCSDSCGRPCPSC
jgi:hypothetical protein